MSVIPIARDEPWTEEDLDDLDDHYRYEIVDGRLLVSPRPATRHGLTASRLFRALIKVIPEGFEVLVEPRLTLATSSREPDLVVVRLADVDVDGMSITPDQVQLAIEIESPSSVGEDRIRKPAEYASAGIPAYWHVSRKAEITVFLLDPGATVYRVLGDPAPRAELPYPVDLVDQVRAACGP